MNGIGSNGGTFNQIYTSSPAAAAPPGASSDSGASPAAWSDLASAASDASSVQGSGFSVPASAGQQTAPTAPDSSDASIQVASGTRRDMPQLPADSDASIQVASRTRRDAVSADETTASA